MHCMTRATPDRHPIQVEIEGDEADAGTFQQGTDHAPGLTVADHDHRVREPLARRISGPTSGGIRTRARGLRRGRVSAQPPLQGITEIDERRRDEERV